MRKMIMVPYVALGAVLGGIQASLTHRLTDFLKGWTLAMMVVLGLYLVEWWANRWIEKA